jgi:hypothetical protein
LAAALLIGVGLVLQQHAAARLDIRGDQVQAEPIVSGPGYG